MPFELGKSVKSSAVLAVCVAIAVYISLNWVKPHIVTRQQIVDPSLVNTYTTFTALTAFITGMLIAFAMTMI
jgi:hypothetical protein